MNDVDSNSLAARLCGAQFPVVELFETVQGEGTAAGAPSLFVRVTGCNLRCWWCDSMFTSWRPERAAFSAKQVAAAVLGTRCGHVVFTGGEPTLYPQALSVLVDAVWRAGKLPTVETNGTRPDLQVAPWLWSVSPKLSSAAPEGGPERARHLAESAARPVDYAAFRARRTQFKFVLASDSDVAEVDSVAAANGLDPSTVWAMPEGVTREAVLERGVWLAEVCKARGWNLCLRQHVLLWGNRRGV